MVSELRSLSLEWSSAMVLGAVSRSRNAVVILQEIIVIKMSDRSYGSHYFRTTMPLYVISSLCH